MRHIGAVPLPWNQVFECRRRRYGLLDKLQGCLMLPSLPILFLVELAASWVNLIRKVGHVLYQMIDHTQQPSDAFDIS